MLTIFGVGIQSFPKSVKHYKTPSVKSQLMNLEMSINNAYIELDFSQNALKKMAETGNR